MEGGLLRRMHGKNEITQREKAKLNLERGAKQSKAKRSEKESELKWKKRWAKQKWRISFDRSFVPHHESVMVFGCAGEHLMVLKLNSAETNTELTGATIARDRS